MKRSNSNLVHSADYIIIYATKNKIIIRKIIIRQGIIESCDVSVDRFSNVAGVFSIGGVLSGKKYRGIK